MSGAAAATPSSRIEVRLLGALSIRRDGAENHTLVAQQKCVALLAFLLLSPRDAYQRRDALVALLWPDSDAERARSSLRTALHRIRSALGDSVIMSRGTEEIAVDRANVWCDAIAFEDAGATTAESALQLYRGDLLGGFFVGDASAAFDQWLDSARARLRERAGSLAWQRARDAVRQADLSAASTAASRAVSLAAADESSARDVMSALAARGHRAAAAALYRELSSMLRVGYDVSPSVETTRLMESLSGAATPTGQVPVPHEHTKARPHMTRVAWAGLAVVLAAALGTYGLANSGRSDGADERLEARWRAWLAASIAPPRTMSSLVFDAGRDQAIVFGGTSGGLALNDVWRLEGLRGGTGASSTPLAIEGGPHPRWGHAAAFDSVADRMIVFGGALGHSSPCANDVWVLDNVSGRRGDSRWRQIRPRGEAPPARANHTAVYDAAANRLIVFGGHDCFARRFNDVWILDGANGDGVAAWKRVSVDSTAPMPVGRSNHSAAFAPRTSNMIILGGVDPDGKALDDAWVLDSLSGGTRWRRVVAEGGPPPLFCHTSGYDGVEDVLVTFGGVQNGNTSSDVWLLSGAGTRSAPHWRRVMLDASVGVARACHTAAYDARADRLFVLGGGRGSALFTDAWVVEGMRRRH